MRLLLALLILLLTISVSSVVYSYLTASDKAKNTIIFGGVNTEIVEDFTPPEELKPGVSFIKDVKVKNLGPSDCYVRVKAVFTDSDMGKYCSVDWNTTDYIYNSKDGYYYYKSKLSVGDLTSSLFTTVTLSEEIGIDEIRDFDILVYSEAYQSDGFDTYTEAWDSYQANKPKN